MLGRAARDDAKEPAPRRSIEVRYAKLDDGSEEFDEIVARNALVHLEKMNDSEFFLLVETSRERAGFFIGAKRAPVGASESWREQVSGVDGGHPTASEAEEPSKPKESASLPASAPPEGIDEKRNEPQLRQLCRDIGMEFQDGRETDFQLCGCLYQSFKALSSQLAAFQRREAALRALIQEPHYQGAPLLAGQRDTSVAMVSAEWYGRLRAALASPDPQQGSSLGGAEQEKKEI